MLPLSSLVHFFIFLVLVCPKKSVYKIAFENGILEKVDSISKICTDKDIRALVAGSVTKIPCLALLGFSKIWCGSIVEGRLRTGLRLDHIEIQVEFAARTLQNQDGGIRY
jgi:hypothetical protein